MGLDFRGSEARWSYGGFNRFRKKLAEKIGINLDDMAGFVEAGKSWAGIDDGIVPLLNHSDCDGELTPDECKQVAPRLRELVSDFPSDDYDKQKAALLADDMEKLAAQGKPLIFT